MTDQHTAREVDVAGLRANIERQVSAYTHDGSDQGTAHWWVRVRFNDAMTLLSAVERTARLEKALTLAANRLDRCSLDAEIGTEPYYERLEWAEAARIALRHSGEG